MTERDRPVYCTQCGSMVDAGDNYCVVCGARISPEAPDATPTQQIPTQVPPPSTASQFHLTPVMVVGFGLVLLLVLGLGSVVGLSLVRGQADQAESSGRTPDRVGTTTEAAVTTRPEENTKEPPAPKGNQAATQADREKRATRDDAQKEVAPRPQEAAGPSSGYNLVETSDGGLSAEVPPSWGVETGEDSEKEAAGPGTWSYHAGEYLFSSITTAPSLEAWYSPDQGSSGAYFVASRALAGYSDYEITHSLLNANKGRGCAEAGPYDDYDRPPLSGKLQTWYDCGSDGATVYSLAAAPEGRECVVALDARIWKEADREAIQHLVDTIEVDCGSVTSEPLATPSAPASNSASAGSEAPDAPAEVSPAESSLPSSSSATQSASAGACPPGTMQNAAGNTCTDLETGDIVRSEPLPENPNTNPCPEFYSMNEEGRCEQIPLP